MFHLRSHLGDLGDDPSTALTTAPASNPLVPSVPVDPAPAPPASTPITLQHLLIIGGIAALVIYLLSRKK